MMGRRVRYRVVGLAIVGVAASATSCGSERDMPDSVEMPDSMEVRRALEDPAAGDAMLDTMPGGEMARGDTAAARRLLRDKMP